MLLPPSRERPRRDPEATSGAQALAVLGRELGALEGRIRTLPVLEARRMPQRYRDETGTLAGLADAGQGLVRRAEALRAALAGADAGGVLDHLPGLRSHLAALAGAVRAREDVLSVPVLLALAVLRALVEGRLREPGARPCVGVLTLWEIEAEMAPFRIRTGREGSPAHDVGARHP